MELSSELINGGFSLCKAEPKDFEAYYHIARRCYEQYVNEYFGGWKEEEQRKRNRASFDQAMQQTFFQKILLNGSAAGFLAYNERADRIDGVSLQMLEFARNRGMGSFFLNRIVSLSDQQGKPVFLQVFRTNPAQNLYRRFGFAVYGHTVSHDLMKYDPCMMR